MHHRLIIMRHAKSDWAEESRPDFDRPLTARGEKAAKKMGKWLKQKKYDIDCVICSPALRAKQTGLLVLEALGIPQNKIIWETGIYEASLDQLISLIDHYGENNHVLLLIGHNPGLDQLLCHLSGDPLPVDDSGKLLTTAAIAVLDYGDSTITTEPRQARLQHLVRPKEA